jgi:hypothetical protein
MLANIPELPDGAVNIFIESGSDGAKLLVTHIRRLSC